MSNTQLYSASATLTDAQIKALPTVNGGLGYEIVPAPGAGKMLLFITGIVSCDTTGGPYDNFAGLATAYFGLTGSQESSLAIPQSNFNLYDWLTYGSPAFIVFSPNLDLDVPTSLLTPVPAQALDGLANASLKFLINNVGEGDLTGGSAANSMKITAIYTIIDV